MGITSSTIALSMHQYKRERIGTHKHKLIKIQFKYSNKNRLEGIKNRIINVATRFDGELQLFEINEKDKKCDVKVIFYSINDILKFKKEIRTTHPNLKIL